MLETLDASCLDVARLSPTQLEMIQNDEDEVKIVLGFI